MAENHDYQALEWVKGEIEETLKQAQQSLEAYVDNPEDSTRMRFCLTHLHQVCGTLQMVEFYGAALLAEEMENLAHSLLSGTTIRVEDAQEVLMRAILQLPAYLDRVQTGRRDMPLVILPLLNDLRAARGESLLSETALFKPDLVAGQDAAPQETVPEDVKKQLPQLLKKVRQLYQFALVGLIRNQDMPTNLGYLAKALAKLEQVYSNAPMAQLWWVAGAVVEGVSRSSIELGTSVKMLLGLIDRHLKQLIDEESKWDEPVPMELLKNLLYYVARCEGESPRIKQVKKAFRLDEALPNSDMVDLERRRLSGPDKATIVSVIRALLEEISTVKETLDVFLRGHSGDIAALRPLVPTLKQVSDTLAVLGIGNPRRVVQEQIDVIGRVIETGILPDDNTFMDVAGALLYVEATLQGMADDSARAMAEVSGRAGEDNENYVSPEHVSKARTAVIEESRAGLENAKDAIMEYIGSKFKKECLEPVPEILHSVRGGLVMVPLHHPADLLKSCVEFIEKELMVVDAAPEWKQLDTLADAITSIEYYLERLGDEFPGDEDILSIAEEAVAALGYPVQRTEEAIEMPLPEIARPVSGNEDETLIASSLVEPELSLSDAGDDIPELEAETKSDPEPEQAEQAPQTVSPEPVMEEEDDLIDDELVEIFVEEAGEVLETINEFLPQWRSNLDNEEARTEVRRAYHTLKGSGRMVGAMVVGELAWSVENMLNRVIDGAVPVSDAVFGIIETVTANVPELVKNFEERTQHTLNVEALAAVADALTKGQEPPPLPANLHGDAVEEAPAPEAIAEESEQAEEIVAEEHAVEEIEPANEVEPVIQLENAEMEAEIDYDEGPEIDPVLIDIFKQEAMSHLHTVKEFLHDAEDHRESFSNPLMRALHTLKGSAHMAGITAIAELASPTEKFIKECHLQGLTADKDIQVFLHDAAKLIEDALDHIEENPSEPIAGAEAFVARIDDLRNSKLRHSQEAEAAEEGYKPDPQLVSIFLAEGTDLILDASDVLRHWEENPVPGEALDNLRRELRILARSASAAQLSEVVALCMALEETYNAASEGMLTPNAGFFDIAHEAHEHLIGMMDRIAVGQKPLAVHQIVTSLQALMDQAPEVAEHLSDADIEVTEDIREATVEEPEFVVEADLEEDESLDEGRYEYEEIDELDERFDEPEMPANENVDVKIELDEDYDPELVEIFLEEANDIVDSISNLLQEWIEDPDDLSKVAELQRDLHTLKGGARMSDMKEVGDLSHHLENLYEGLCEHRFTAVPALFEVLHGCHDRLATMVDKIQTGAAVAPAQDLIDQIEQFMKTGSIEGVAVGAPVEEPASIEPAATDTVAETVAMDEAAEERAIEEEVQSAEPFPPASDSDAANDEAALDVLSEGDGEEIDSEILEVFVEEADELTEGIEAAVSSWLAERDNTIHLEELKRLLHTFKGGARLAGLMKLGDVSHDFETFVMDVENSGAVMDDAFFQEVQARQDAMFEQIAAVRKRINQILGGGAAPAEVAATSKPAPKPIPAGEGNVVPITDQPLPEESFVIPGAAAPSMVTVDKAGAEKRASSGESVKVSADLIESLVNLAGETSIIRGRIEQEITDFSFDIEEIGMTIDRVRELLRRMELETEAQIVTRYQQEADNPDYGDFDPLEMDRYSTLNQLSRSLGESASDLMDLKDSLVDRARDSETLLMQQARINTELQEGLMRTRMVPFSRMVPRLRRIIRQIATELGKKAELEIVGAEGEMDRTVLERMIAPLEHMLRNAVDHGIESVEERKAKGKKEVGRITLHLTREGGDVVLRLADDGKGINLEGVKKRAIERGLMKEDSPLTDKEIMQFIFKAGFSTAEKVTQISGRGVGMDVVHSEIKLLGGNLKIHSYPGAGSQFTIRLPFTVSVNRALMVSVGEDFYAIPLNNIEGIVRVSPYELEAYYQPDAPEFEYAGSNYRMKYLGGFVHNINTPNLQGHTKPLPVLLVRGTDHAMALQVDSLLGSREIVVKSVGPQLSAVSGLSGATILGDGSVVIILDLMAMIRAEQAQISLRESMGLDNQAPEVMPEQEEQRTPVIMVVDDSVTVRKVTTRLLERHGFEVTTAKDGVDAITKLQDFKPDCMLLDIEMPRMDGFEVATLIRHDERLQDTPIIMITSRTGEKHRERAESIGVNEYMGKPYQETALLQTIEALIKQGK